MDLGTEERSLGKDQCVSLALLRSPFLFSESFLFLFLFRRIARFVLSK